MSIYFGQSNTVANEYWDGEVQSLYRWYEERRNMKENIAAPSEEYLGLYSTKDYFLGPLESAVSVPETQWRQVNEPNRSFEKNIALKSQIDGGYDELTNNGQYTTPLLDPEFVDLINFKPEKEVNPELIEGNAAGDIASQRSLAYSQPSHVAQLYHDSKVFSTISQKQTKRGSYRCPHCSENFPTLLKFAAHLDDFNLERPYKCPIGRCPWKILGFQQATGLRRHCASQHRGELNIEMEKSLNLKVEKYPGLYCPFSFCQKFFKRRDAYKRHVAMVHNNADSRFNKRLKKHMNNTSG